MFLKESEMKKRQIGIFGVSIIVLAVFGLVFASCSKKDESKKYTIRFGHDTSVDTPTNKACVKFKEIVEKDSDGRITVTIFPGAQLGSAKDMFEQVRMGDLEMSLAATTHLSPTIPKFYVLDLFNLFDNVEHARKVMDGPAGDALLKEMGNFNLVGLGFREFGFRNFSNSQRPLLKIEDFKGLRIRGYNPIQVKAWSSTGATLTTVNWTELFTALSQKLVDGQECAIKHLFDNRFHEVQKYISLTEHTYTTAAWYINKDFWNEKMTEADREIVSKARNEIIAYERDLTLKAEKDALQKIKEYGCEINEVSLDTKHQLAKTLNDAVREDIIAKCGREIYDLFMTEIKKARS
jgi:tripartite ATP-independent transporter DctP family solute receptor